MKNRLILFLTILSPLLSFSQKHISLDQCLKAAEINSPLARQHELIKNYETNQVKLLNTNNLLQAELTAKATWQSEVTSLPIELPGITVPKASQDQYQIAINLNQKLLDGGLIKEQKKLASINSITETENLNTKLYALNERITALYFSALLMKKQTKITENLLNVIAKQEEKLVNLVQNGAAIKADLNELVAKKIELQKQALTTNKNSTVALDALSELTGITITKTDTLTEYKLTQSSSQRPEISFLNAQQLLLKQQEKLITSSFKPKLNLFGTAGYGKPGLNFLDNQFRPYFLGGVQLKVPISNWYTGAKSNQLTALQIKANQIDSEIENFNKKQTIEIAEKHKEIAHYKELKEYNLQLSKLREEIMTTYEDKLNNGIITVSDYVTEVNKYQTTLIEQSITDIQLQLATKQLQIIKGI